ncbi:MAG: hypothetical protein KA314_07675 [Chloroflexi bacterium]|nr:hypothetical protein [Chloroflexota bacterium]MBP8055707.1 hypothetical protein [Chloroflexota bacterium]
MQESEVVAMVCGSISVIVIPLFLVFSYMTLSRYWRYRETVMLAERGLLRQTNGNGHSSANRNSLRWGIIVSFVGLALCLGTWPIGFWVETPFGLGPWMLIGLLPMFFGLALLVLYGIGRWEAGQPYQAMPTDEEPPSKYTGE